MIIVSQAELDRIRAGTQTAILQLGECSIQADWGPQPIRVGYRGETDWVRVVAKRPTRMGLLTDADALLLAAPSIATYRAAWNQRHPMYDRWHVNRVCTFVRLVYNGVPEEYRQRDVFELLKEQSPV